MDLDLGATRGFEAFHDVEGLAVEGGLLVGTTGAIPVLRLGVDPIERDDVLHSVRVRLRVSEGGTLGLYLSDDDELDRERALRRLRRSNFWLFSTEVEASEEPTTVTVEMSHAPAERLDEIRHLFLQPTDSEGARIAIEEVRFVSRSEHLAGIPSGVSWQGLSEVYRESLVLRAPERVTFEAALPQRPWIDLAVGSIEPGPVTLRVDVRRAGSDAPTTLLKRTVTTHDRWEEVPVDLSAYGFESVELGFSVESEASGRIGLFGTPVVRDAREGAPEPAAAGPTGVILILADTLRRDHLDMYGYERSTAPFLTQLAGQGALFLDNVSQGSWTKVSVPSMLTSTYPTSNGIVSARDRLPDSVTTLAEAFQQDGWATFATSSVFFTGKLSNLDQGVDVLHERSSVGELPHEPSKTARTFVDRLTGWLEERRGGRFYAMLHVFDPHSPFEPYQPYEGLWSEPGAKKEHERVLETVREWQEENDEDPSPMPPEKDLVAAGVDVEPFVAREIDWYDASIRAMDVEIGRLFERLDELGLADDTLVAFVSDHGEEFLEHGRHFHGESTYGEMTNVPLFLWGPRWVPSGTVVEETVQSLDLMPTLLELAELPIPDQVQGRSLMPLVRGEGGWVPRPALSENRIADFEREPDPDEIESFSIVYEGYRLIRNGRRPEGHPEFELYDHVADPLNRNDLAGERPELVADFAAKLEACLAWAEANRLESLGEGEELSAEEAALLESLGYH